MIELTLSFERKPIKSYKFNKDVILIGRDPTCDIQIDNVGISRHHCRIERQGNIYILSDLASGNGTFVGGQRITKHNLNDGDEIGLWNYSLLFKSLGGDPVVQCAPTAEPKEKKPLPKMDLDATIAIDSRQLDLKQRERSSTVRGYLTYQEPKRGERTYSLIKTATFFGKGDHCDFRLSGWFIMPKHAMVLRDETGFRFVNFAKHSLGTVNDKTVNDQRLREGDVIKVGGIAFKYHDGLPTVK